MNHSVVRSFTKFGAMSGLALATLWFAASAAADQRAAMQVCRADAQKLCASTPPGGGRIVACLRENESKLSPGCQAQLGKLEGCAAEIKALCPQVQGDAGLRQCVRAKRSEVSEGCRTAAGG